MPKIILSNQYNPYLNIAVENYLLSLPSDGDITMYLWQNQRTVVIGQNQNPFRECDVERLEQDGGYLMRRRTGGGAVFHDLGNLNFSFIVPYEMYDQGRQFSVLQRAVESFGLTTEISGRNDVLCQGRKFSGNAFAKGRQQRLHHGTILIRTDVSVLQRYLKVNPAKLQKHGVASVQSRVVNLSELNEAITSQSIVAPLVEAFKAEYGSDVQVLDFNHIALQPEVVALRDEFASDEWRFGRWTTFSAQQSAQFDWGGVEVSLVVDQAAGLITSATVASDSLFPSAIAMAENVLVGASTSCPPAIPAEADETERKIINDIFSLLF